VTKQRYSRQQAIKLSGSTSSRLTYLDRIGLVVPEKIGDSKKPVVLYTDKHIEQIKLINKAAEFLSLDGIKLAIKKKRLPEVVEFLAEILS
jgi:DNA-binding transcriptional MerR regulator